LTKAVDLQTENNEEVSFPCAACEICGERS
jgi:hypothetical protein